MGISDRELKEAALVGLRHQRMALDEQIHALERALKDGVGRKIATASTAGPARKRVLSAAARQRIAAAQRKRWAAVRKAKKKGR